MTEPETPTMDRLQNIENDVSELKSAVVQITEILVNHDRRFDAMQRSMDGMQRSMDGMQRSMETIQHSMHSAQQSMEQRLDRLIAATLEERTLSYERLRDIELRLAKLEERARS